MARKTQKTAEVIAQRETMATKINRLLDKAASTTHEAEAATFMDKAHALMAEHQLSFSDLASLDVEDVTGYDAVALTYWKSENWVGSMAFCLARFYGLEGVRSTVGNQHSLLVIGRQSARETFKAMAPFCKKEVHRLAREKAKEDHRSASVWAGEIGKALALRLQDMKAANDKAEEERIASGGFALVPYDAIAAIKEELFPSGLKKSPTRKVRISKAAREVAEGINLAGQVGSDAADLARLLAAE